MNHESKKLVRVPSALLAVAVCVLPIPSSAGVAVGGGAVGGQVIEYVSGGRVHRWVISDSEYCVEQSGRAPRIGKMPLPGGVDLLSAFRELNTGADFQAPIPAAIQELLDQDPDVGPPKYHPVVYPVGKEGQVRLRGVLRPMVNLIVANGAVLEDLQNQAGASAGRWVVQGRAAVLEFASVEDAVASLAVLAAIDGVEKAYPEISGRMEKKTTIPPDPLFTYTPPRVNYQWHLRNIGANGGIEGVDVNITDVWDTYSGSGVVIGIVDDGLETFHPDLFLNVDFVNDWDFNGDDDNPNPLNDSLDGIVDSHGTSVGGVAGARWNNGIGGVGSAPECTLIGLRVLGDLFTATEDMFAQAVAWDDGGIDISNNSWGPADPNGFVDTPLVVSAMQAGVLSARGGLGRIFCFAAGNDGAVEGNTSHSTLTTAPESVVVGALNDDGTRSFFSTPGAALTISAPSGGSANQQNITTTTLTNINGGYTDDFSGTSSATPLVSGCIALMLEANPGLGWRDVQEILMRSARKNNELHRDWIDNAAGMHFNHQFGAGMIDTQAAVEMAETWTNLTARQMVEVERTDFILRYEPDPDNPDGPPLPVGTVIPDGGLPLDVLINAANFTDMRSEHVVLNLDVEHANRTELEVTLISPSGTSSEILDNFIGDEANISYDFPMSTVRNWGEKFPGVWRVRIRDTVVGNVGELKQIKLTVYGTTPDGLPPRELPGLEGGRRYTFRVNEFSVVPLEGTPDGSTVSITAGDLPDGLAFDPGLSVVYGAPTAIGEYPVEITVNNGPDSRSFIVMFVVGEAPGSTLGEAIDQTPESTTSIGNAGPWQVELDETFDGSDSVVSPPGMPNNFYSQLNHTSPGDGVMVYSWRTSSEENRDRVWFYRSGDPEQDWLAFASGIRDWGRVAVPVEAGQVSRWRFSRDDLGSFGTNQAWVDTVSVIPFADFVTSVEDVLGQSGTISFSGKSYWLTEPSIVDGSVQEVVRSPSIGNGQHSGLVMTVEGPAHLTYKWKIDSAPLDYLYLLVDGNIAAAIQGFVDWDESTFEIPAGTHQVEWRFSKDNSFSFSADAAFLQSIDAERFMNYGAWLAQFLNSEQMADPFYTDQGSDPEGDGWTNFDEYVFGGNPMVVDNGPLPNEPKLVTNDSGDLVYRFEIAAIVEDVAVRIEESTDLSSWGPSIDATITPVGDNIRYEVPMDGTGGSKYFRVYAESTAVAGS